MKKRKILVIDDDVDICTLLKRFLERKGFDVTTVFKASDGLSTLNKQQFDLVLSDFRLPDMDGFEIIKSIRAIHTTIPIIVITGYSDVKQAVKVIQMGAYEYVTKPIYPEEILIHINSALSDSQVSYDDVNKTDKNAAKTTFKTAQYIFGKSQQSQQVQHLIQLVAPTEMTVVVLGKSGTGKEVVARMIHQLSKRRDNPFVAVDCGALPQELAGSELFGHEKGAFTGAVATKKGHFEMANGGTLFLDEIGNLSYENQVKLLRVLQERVVRRIGDEKDRSVDVRIIVATNEDLADSMRKGDFREDIYYRINEFKIDLPSLKDNKEDLFDFASFFLDKANKELHKNISGFSKSVRHAFENYSWPGNIRELKNVIKRAVLLTQNNEIENDVLPSEIINSQLVLEGLNSDEIPMDLKSVVEIAESQAIIRAMQKVAYNKSKCAELLGIDRKTLYNKINAYGIKGVKK